ncbi:hypothetical protein C0V70_17830 [Bacteriovorax stolpii]|uniref:Uncharacterized protein n=1 Tax=Bacteriovorax stolpii TaxID=960 RepID=A0A2K9NWP7_BACTC|nr:hypothetical protein [Bacteriovorax stolpii]AUN99931.1 hypothetical protein C0V70_17830 [Bacteriovorax stolpii]TDP54175.1 hypothetical protein C8D79_1468 [Bacteriovorax stolpii]
MVFFERFKKAGSTLQFIAFALLFTILFLRVNHQNMSVEKNIYDYYSESIVNDFDLNVINQVPDKERWQITRSGNWPDVHSNGIVTMWAPFFAYKKVMQTFVSEDNKKLIVLTRSLATVFFSVVTIILMVFLLGELFPGKNRGWVFITLSLTTSYWWFTFVQPGNADVTSSVFATFEIGMFFYLLKNWSTRSLFFFGLLLGAGLALKIDHIFYFILPVYLLIQYFLATRSFKATIKNGLIFSAGVLINLIPMLVNDSVKFGFVNYGYADVVNFDYYMLWPNLVYPSGFFNNCPIYFACFVGLISLLFEKKKDIPLIILGSIPFLALVIESFARIHHESYGARHWVPHFAIFAILLMSLYEKIKDVRWKKILFVIFIVLASGQNIIKGFSYILNYEHFFFGRNQWQEMAAWFSYQGITGLFANIFYFPEVGLKLRFMLPLVLICAFGTMKLYRYLAIEKKSILALVSVLTVYFSCSYLLITGLNLKYNQQNYIAYKATGKLDQAIVGAGPNIQSLFENLGTYEKLLRFYRYREDEKRVQVIEKSRKAYIQKAASEIIYDPVGFKESLLKSDGGFISDEIRDD